MASKRGGTKARAGTRTGKESDPGGLTVELERAGAALRAGLEQLRTGDDPPVELLLPHAREVQRLTEALIAELVRTGINQPGSAPIETVLSGDGTIPRRQVQTEIERARIADEFPALGSGMSNGETPTANVDVLARITGSLTGAEAEQFKAHDADLADAASRLSEESFRKRAQRLRDKIRLDGGTTAAAQVKSDSYARVTPTPEREAYRLNAYLDPLRGAAIKAAIEREARTLADDPASSEGMTPAQLSAQALHDLVLRGDSMERTSVPRANVTLNVLCDPDTLAAGPHEDTIAETHDGLPIGAGAVGRLCCDATLRRIDTAPDADVQASRASRSPSEAQRMALRAMYPSCPISGTGWENIEVHHVVFYSQSQRTVLSELVPISRRWHHLIHDEGWTLEMDPDRTLHLSQPDGTPFRTIAPPTPINVSPSATPSCSLRSQHRGNDHTLAA